MFLMDVFLGGDFTKYGINVAEISELNHEERTDHMSKIFPRVTKCTFHRFGPSGTVEKIDGMCVLALNVINEKIYVFLWFWFVILGIITALQVSKYVRKFNFSDKKCYFYRSPIVFCRC